MTMRRKDLQRVLVGFLGLPNGGGAQVAGPWIDEAAGTVGHVTGTFPIAANDPAYQYDRNPNRIGQFDVAYELPVTPTVAGAPGCLPPAAIAILRNGVVVFAPLDERNRNAVAYETVLDGYPIVVERDADGDLPTNADLDECHGRTSAVLLDGEIVETYHYSATHEFPYFIGCFHGTADF